jgi:hypothetical protein
VQVKIVPGTKPKLVKITVIARSEATKQPFTPIRN